MNSIHYVASGFSPLCVLKFDFYEAPKLHNQSFSLLSIFVPYSPKLRDLLSFFYLLRILNSFSAQETLSATAIT